MEISIDYNSEHNKKNHIEGLQIFNNVITETEELKLLEQIDELQNEGSSIRNKLRTRVTMHFNHAFSAKTLKIDFNDNVPEIPNEIKALIKKIFASQIKFHDLLNWKYDQVTINRYQGKGGIAAHIDTHSSFDMFIVIVSLGSSVVMRFQHNNNKKDIWVPARSLMIMSDQARYLYTHKIPTRKTDVDPANNIVKRGDRTSVTIRKVRKDMICECDYPEKCDYQTPESFHTPDRL